MSLTCRDSEERALAMAMVIMGANIAGIYGAQIFRADDKPRYRRGFSIGIGVLALGLVLAAIRYVDERIQRRRNRGRLPVEETASDRTSQTDEVDEKAGPPLVLEGANGAGKEHF